ncbi:MAG: glycosyltransferase, family [Candidatus Solibacter sp.]|nr:glycosyltransferase, family [Candidatus Solibacter sp.]
MRIAFSTLAASGHLNPMLTLARKVRERGHDVFFVGGLDCEASVRGAGFEFRSFAESEFPAGFRREMEARLSKLHGIAGLRFTLDQLIAVFEAEVREGPRVLREARAEAAVVDEVPGGIGLAAEKMALPVVRVANALPILMDARIPPPFVDWAYGEGWVSQLRNQAAWGAFRFALRPFFQAAKRHGADVNIGGTRIAQLPKAFDFPVPAPFHHTGPFHDARWRTPVAFPWERLNGAPLIYASMGTVQNGSEHVFRTIAEACSGLGCQLVMSLGENVHEAAVGATECITVRHARQLELLQRATLCVTHAGMNTALESASAGVPMVAIPITNDQPGVAARIAYTGTGIIVRYRGLSAARLRRAVTQVLGDARYAENARRVREEIQRADGLTCAALIIEETIRAR